jgi:hypothetical protein
VNAVIRFLWVICAVLVADAFAADPDARSPEGESPSQPSLASPEAVAQSSAAAPSVMGQKATTTDPSAAGKSETDAKSGGAATSHANDNAQTVANKSVKNVLVDDTVTDAQLKQILAKGYRPVTQASGNEVSYCRNEQLAGERFQTKVCKTARRILEDEQRGKDLVNSVERIGLQMGR